MSSLQRILVAAKADLAPWEPIPEARWPGIAAQCGPEEAVEIHHRIAALEAELAAVQSWDGDTQIEIQRAIEFFQGILSLMPQ